MKHDVTVFKPYPFEVGQKIRIEDTKRAGDWEIAAVSENTVTLRCPVSHREFEWKIFCYATEQRSNTEWPQKN